MIKLEIALLFFLVTVATSVEMGSTKINTNRDTARTEVCEYYSANFTDKDRALTQPLIDAYDLLTDEQI